MPFLYFHSKYSTNNSLVHAPCIIDRIRFTLALFYFSANICSPVIIVKCGASERIHRPDTASLDSPRASFDVALRRRVGGNKCPDQTRFSFRFLTAYIIYLCKEFVMYIHTYIRTYIYVYDNKKEREIFAFFSR